MAAIQSGRRLRDLSGRVVMNVDPEAAEPADAGTIQTVHPDGIPIRLDPVTNYHSIHSAPVAKSRLRPDDGWRCQPTGRSEERRVGKERVSTCRYRGRP